MIRITALLLRMKDGCFISVINVLNLTLNHSLFRRVKSTSPLGSNRILLSNYLLLSVIISTFCYGYLSQQSALAGGFDRPEVNRSEADQPLSSTNSNNQQGLMLNWSQWSKPYHQGKKICRESNGNVVCFNPQLAQKLSWHP